MEIICDWVSNITAASYIYLPRLHSHFKANIPGQILHNISKVQTRLPKYSAVVIHVLISGQSFEALWLLTWLVTWVALARYGHMDRFFKLGQTLILLTLCWIKSVFTWKMTVSLNFGTRKKLAFSVESCKITPSTDVFWASLMFMFLCHSMFGF